MSGINFVQENTDATGKHALTGQYSIPKKIQQEIEKALVEKDPLLERKEGKSVYNKESDYHKRRLDRRLSNSKDEKEEESFSKKRRWDVAEPSEHNSGDVLKRSKWDVKDTNFKPSSIQTYVIPEINASSQKELGIDLVTGVPGVRDLQFFKPSDKQFFGQLLDGKKDSELSKEEAKERQLLRLLLRVKNGSSSTRKAALRTLTEHAREFGAKSLFNCVLPILLDKNLEDQERHLLIKVVDRILYKLNELVRPYTHKILVVTSPLLIDEDPLARSTGREIISNLARAAGLATMISTMRPDIDHADEYVRNTTARAMAIVAKALGISQLMPFIKAVCQSKKSWRARHTGVKVVQQISILLGVGVLPHLNGLVDCISNGLSDEHLPVRIITANALSSLAQSSHPYGIEAFNIVLEPLWKGIRTHRGKALASFLKALGFIIPLMDPEYAGYYTHEIMRIIKREFRSPDDEMKKTVLLVIQKCANTEGITPKYLKEEVVPDFYKNFWARRISLDRQINKIVTYTTVVLSEKIGCPLTIQYLLGPLKDESEPFRTMAVHAVNRVVKLLGTSDLDERLENRLIDALLITFQEQTNEDRVIFKGFGTVVMSLEKRMKPYLAPIVSTILNRLKHKTPMIRQHAADLCAVIIPVIKICGEFEMLNKLNVILYESLGEVYPEVLGSIIGAMKNIVAVMEFQTIQPPINQLLPTLTPILRNRHRKVQENTIDLVGRIAERGPEYVPPKEWMRICFELLEMLKSTNKAIRRAANSTFGYIAKAVGPQEVLVTLLNNLKVQERQLRVCTAVAIGIVSETCGPFTVLPALMNEYKTPETNVQNGVLKAMSFMFEYIGSMSKDYIYAITPLLQDALMDRDLVHRQTAASVIRHLALGCMGLGYEDAFIHMLNLLIPNIFETSPHVIFRILEGIEALRNAVGPGVTMNYVWAGLFHPARNVRKAFWKVHNNSYVQHLDSLVPYYPELNELEYQIAELHKTL